MKNRLAFIAMALICVVSLSGSGIAAASAHQNVYVPQQTNNGKLSYRVYAKFGYLLLQPSATGLGYSTGNDYDLDQYLDVNGLNFGAGAQVLFPKEIAPSLRLGLDVGFQKLLSLTFDTGSSDLDAIVEDYDQASEFDVYFHGMVEFSPEGAAYFLQGGLGLRMVIWSWDTVYYGYYTGDQSVYETGVDVGFGLFVLAGFNAVQNETLRIPVGVRIDWLLRYNSLIKASVVLGFAF